MGASLERLDDPREEAPMFVSSPMIIKMKKLIPHQRANTRDPEIRNPALKSGEGSSHTSYLLSETIQVSFLLDEDIML